jgi:hypothetical protein
MTTNVTETIRKVMGWCPNVDVMDARKEVQFDDRMVNMPNKGGKNPHEGARWWNKYHNRVLLEFILFMYLAVSTFDVYGKVNLNMYFIGAIVGLFFHFLMGVNNWRRFNSAACKGVAQAHSTRKIRAITFMVTISLLASVVFLVTNVAGGMAFISGTMLFFGIKILGVLYWEQKNGKTLIIHKKSFFFAVDISALGTE